MSTTAAHVEHREPTGTASVDAFVVGPGLLAEGASSGPLSGLSFAVKDLFDVAGTRTGVGNPTWLADAPVATRSAPVVDALVAAGADLVGKTTSDELAFSLSGTNVHYGTPLHPTSAASVPGGSSSGSVSAVARGLVDFALGTDTGGSTRVPASYCGIYGLRTTHGRVNRSGTYLLAPSFCTVGLFARDAMTLERCWSALEVAPGIVTSAHARRAGSVVLWDALFDLVDADARAVVEASADELVRSLGLPVRHIAPGAPEEIFAVFRTIQTFEAWQRHGAWVRKHPGALGPGIAARFATAAEVTRAAYDAAVARRRELCAPILEALGDEGFLLQPAASGGAPPILLDGAAKADLRYRTMQLTSVAGLLGSPVAVAPAASVHGLPVGLAVVGCPGDDREVVALCARAARRA